MMPRYSMPQGYPWSGQEEWDKLGPQVGVINPVPTGDKNNPVKQ
jgi:hypothetical protein